MKSIYLKNGLLIHILLLGQIGGSGGAHVNGLDH